MKNLAKQMKRQRDNERRLDKVSPQISFVGGESEESPGVSDPLNLATKTELTAGLAGKSDTTHTHEFTELTDAPTAYTGNAGKAIVVKATEDGLEFGNAGSGGSGSFDYGLITDAADISIDYGGLG